MDANARHYGAGGEHGEHGGHGWVGEREDSP
jgi:hypothetical protein